MYFFKIIFKAFKLTELKIINIKKYAELGIKYWYSQVKNKIPYKFY